MHWSELESFAFADGEGGKPGDKALADSLLALVLAGKKTATCWPASWDGITHVGKRMVVLDSERRPRAVIETTSLVERPFNAVDWDFARLEGENDDLEGWRRDHREWLTANADFSPDMLLCCEQFKVIEILPETA